MPISTADQVRAKARHLITLLSWRAVRPFEDGQRSCRKPRILAGPVTPRPRRRREAHPRCVPCCARYSNRFRLSSGQSAKGENRMSRIASWATVALVVLNTDLTSPVSARAESAALALDGTLRKIKETGAITLAHREFSVPFSYYDDKQQPVGYAMDLCYRIVDAVKKDLRLDKLEVK